MLLGKLFVLLGIKKDASLKRAPASFDSAKSSAGGLTRGLGALKIAFATLGIALVVRQLARFVTSATQVASVAIETQNLFATSFGDMKDKATEWADAMQAATGVNDTTLKDMSGTLFNMVEAMGVTKDGAFALSTGFTELALDTASFFNLPFEDAFTKIQAGLSGEIEPLKRLGVVVSEAAIKNTDFAKSILASRKELTEAEKVQARAIVIQEGLRNASGDLVKTQDTYANQTRLVGEAWVDLQETFGAFIATSPQLGAVISAITSGIRSTTESIRTNEGMWSSLVKGAIIFALDAFSRVVQTIGFIIVGFGKLGGALDAGIIMFLKFAEATVKTINLIAGIVPGVQAIGDAMALKVAQTREAVEADKALADQTVAMGQKFLVFGAGVDRLKLQVQGMSMATNDAAIANQSLGSSLEGFVPQADSAFAAQDLLAQQGRTLIQLYGAMRGEVMQVIQANILHAENQIETANMIKEEAIIPFGEAVTGVGDLVGNQNQRMVDAFHSMGLKTKLELQLLEREARANFEQIKQSGQFTAEELERIWEQTQKNIREQAQLTSETKISMEQAAASGAAQILGTFGQKNKVAAIAKASIDTFMAANRTWAQLGFPMGIPAVAAVIAQGVANVARIKSQNPGFRTGTPNMDFMDFGSSTNVQLHGQEAVIPRGGGSQLAAEIAKAQKMGTSGGSGGGGATIIFEVDGRQIARAMVPALEELTKKRVLRIHPAATGKEF